MRPSKARSELSVGVSHALGHIRRAVHFGLVVKHPRWKPDAGKPQVRFCAGGRIAICVPTAILISPLISPGFNGG